MLFVESDPISLCWSKVLISCASFLHNILNYECGFLDYELDLLKWHWWSFIFVWCEIQIQFLSVQIIIEELQRRSSLKMIE